MSSVRHKTLVRGYAVTHPTSTVSLPTGPGYDQLIYASRGVMRIEVPGGIWVLPPDRALWVPDQVPHTVRMVGRVALRSLYFPSVLRVLPPHPRVVDVPPLLRELILHALKIAPLHLDVPAHERLAGVIADQVAALPVAPLQLRTPRDPRARTVADLLAADGDLPLEAAARAAGLSRRTAERLFRAETGLSPGRWRQRLRLVEALRLLGEGRTATQVATAVGYATPSAFGEAFRRELGTSPGRYFAT
jgi:AraC-like DNA-binding protein